MENLKIEPVLFPRVVRPHGRLDTTNCTDFDMNVYLIDFSKTRPRSVIADFARLEAIFLVDNAPLENKSDLDDYMQFITDFYSGELLFERRKPVYAGRHRAKVARHAAPATKMREYAFLSVRGNQGPIPYYMALLGASHRVLYGSPCEHAAVYVRFSTVLFHDFTQNTYENFLALKLAVYHHIA